MIEWERPEWHGLSKCRGVKPALFYPEKIEGEDATAVAKAAKAVCNGFDGRPACPVKEECLDWALANHEKFGVWGGRTERERTALKRMRKKVNGVPRVIRTVKKSPLRQLLDTSKVQSRILGAIQRHLMVRVDEKQVEYQAQSFIHPSEMCKPDWCHRATFFRLIGAPALDREPNHFTLENVFAEGNDIHDKWQTWLWEMGLLRGEFACMSCGEIWSDTAPKRCPSCESERSCLKYREVPLRSDRYLIIGHADGDIADDDNDELCPLLEVKSIGVGTLRFEAPQLLAKHTRKVADEDGGEKSIVDYDAVWRDIKRPFPSHVKQGTLYLLMAGRKKMVFVYECKWNQQVKEFTIKFQSEIIEDLLDSCLDIKYALEANKPPRRPSWAAQDHSTCGKCVYRESCYDAYLEKANGTDEEPGARNGRAGDESESRPRTRRVVIAGSSGLRDSKAAAQNH